LFACRKAALAESYALLACTLTHVSVELFACKKAALALANADGTKEEKSLVESNLDGGT
jgi:hypothetical protein